MSDRGEKAGQVRWAPLAPVALSMMSGVMVDRFTDLMTSRTCAVASFTAGCLAGVVWRSRWVSSICLMVAFGLLGAAWHHRCWSDLAADDLAALDWSGQGARPCWLKGVILEPGQFRKVEGVPGREGSTRSILDVTAVHDLGAWRAASGRLQVSIVGDRSDLKAGQAVQVAGSLGPIEGPLNPGELDIRPILRAEGIRLRLVVDDVESVWLDPNGVDWPFTRWLGTVRDWSLQRLTSGFDPSVAPLASALLLGRRERVDPEVNDAFSRTGTTHLLAISGLQLQVLAAFVALCLRSLGVRRKPTLALVAVGTVGYAVLVGLAPSVVRSAAMTVGASLAGFRDRSVTTANQMSGALLATLILNPADLFDIGCQLSFLAVAAIIWLVPEVLAWNEPKLEPLDVLERKLEPWWMMLGRMGLNGFKASLLGSAVVWIVAWPLVELKFHLFSPVGILINLPLIPLTSLALLLAGLTLALSAFWPPLGWPSAWACGKCLVLTEFLVRWGKNLSWGHHFVPGPSWILVAIFYALLALATLALGCRWKSARGWWLALVVFSFGLSSLPMFSTRPTTPEVEFLAVGHGLAVVVRSPEGRTALYDCGKMGDPHVGRRIIAPALWARGISQVDVLILSHADSDHFNGLDELLDRFAFNEVRIPPGFGGTSNPSAQKLLESIRAHGLPILPIYQGITLNLGNDLTLQTLHPAPVPEPSSKDNARSVVLAVASQSRCVLLTGDLEGGGLLKLVEQPPQAVEVMLAPHHGGRTSNPAWLYDWARPRTVIASQKPPTPGSRDALEPLALSRFTLLRTWQTGAIRLRWLDDEIEISPFLEPATRQPARSPR